MAIAVRTVGIKQKWSRAVKGCGRQGAPGLPGKAARSAAKNNWWVRLCHTGEPSPSRTLLSKLGNAWVQASLWKCRWNFAQARQNRTDPLGVRIGSPAARKMRSWWRPRMKQKFLRCANQSFHTFVTLCCPQSFGGILKLNIHLQENVMPRSAVSHSGLKRSLISKLFHPATSQNNCDHDKGWKSREAGRNGSTQKKKKHPLSLVGCSKWIELLCLPVSLLPRF